MRGEGATGGSNGARAWGTIQGLAASGNVLHREYAAAALALLAEKQSRALKEVGNLLLADKESGVRAFTAAALGQERVRASIPRLRQALDDAEAPVVFAAAKALWDMKDHSGALVFREVLTGARKDSGGMISGYMADAREKMHNPRELALLGVKEASSAFLGPAAMAFSFAQETMKDKGATGRAYAATALAQDHSTSARKVLETALQDSNAIVRAAACRSLAILEDREALVFIEPLLDDKNDTTKAIASAAYLRLHASAGAKVRATASKAG
jgi:HEAT repeat protein